MVSKDRARKNETHLRNLRNSATKATRHMTCSPITVPNLVRSTNRRRIGRRVRAGFCRSGEQLVDNHRQWRLPSSTIAMKMAPEVRWLLAFLISCVVPFSRGETPHRKFEYKYSFKPPYLAQKDGTVPFWEYGGSEYIATPRYVACNLTKKSTPVAPTFRMLYSCGVNLCRED